MYFHSSNEIQLNDIALLKLYRKFTFNQYIKPIRLAWKDIPGGGQAQFSGWGYTQPNNEKTAVNLQLIDLPIITIDGECI